MPYRYGLGTCYMRMSRLRLAEYHYRKAADIHPRNAVLLGCVGMVSQGKRSVDCLSELALMGPWVYVMTGSRTFRQPVDSPCFIQ